MDTLKRPIDLEVYRRVAERHHLVFERVHGSFTDAARYMMTQWDYNEVRPHSSLGRRI